jgi:hypothetical protein
MCLKYCLKNFLLPRIGIYLDTIKTLQLFYTIIILRAREINTLTSRLTNIGLTNFRADPFLKINTHFSICFATVKSLQAVRMPRALHTVSRNFCTFSHRPYNVLFIAYCSHFCEFCIKISWPPTWLLSSYQHVWRWLSSGMLRRVV